jgi:hypothetical protein
MAVSLCVSARLLACLRLHLRLCVCLCPFLSAARARVCACACVLRERVSRACRSQRHRRMRLEEGQYVSRQSPPTRFRYDCGWCAAGSTVNAAKCLPLGGSSDPLSGGCDAPDWRRGPCPQEIAPVVARAARCTAVL